MAENPTKPAPAKAKPDVSDDLLAKAQEKAPGISREFVDKHGLTAEQVEAYASGLDSPPPVPDPAEDAVTDLHLTPGGWQATPKGVKPEGVGKDAISR